jgi:hypothetical protein
MRYPCSLHARSGCSNPTGIPLEQRRPRRGGELLSGSTLLTLTSTLPGADIRGFYRALEVLLPEWATTEASVRCFANPGAHAREDRDPSCSVNLETGAWHCWGCGASGGAYGAAIALWHTPAPAMDLLIDYGLAERRSRSRSSGWRPPRPPASAPARPLAPEPPPRRLRVGEAEIARWKRALTQSWPVAQLRDEQRRLWQRQTADELDVGWERGRVIIPIRGARRRRARSAALCAAAHPRSQDAGDSRNVPRAGPWSRTAPGTVVCAFAEGPPDMITATMRGIRIGRVSSPASA